VVDSSDNNAARIAKSFVPRIKLVRCRRKTGASDARNIGIMRAKGDIIALTDTDCVVGSDWIEIIHQTQKTHCVAGGPVINGNPRDLLGWVPFLMEFGEFAVRKSRFISNMPTCNISYKRRIFYEYGYFPSNQLSGLGDDFVFNAQINEKLFFSDKIIVAHLNKTNPVQILRHAREQGKADAQAIKLSPQLSGQLLIKWKFLIPLLFFYRFVAIGWRAVRSGNFMIFFLVSPLVAFNIFSWNIGFLKGALK
jgi:glycosyltransferase involved in cell wall biosynthesis